MKKLLTLLLVLTGIVGTANGKTIYFANNWHKSGLRIHQWGGTGATSWPGNAFPSAESTKIDGYDVYALDLGECTNFMILYTNDSDSNTEYGNTEYIESISTTVRKCADTSTSDLNEGDYIDFSDWNSGNPTMTSALTVHTHDFTITTAEDWTDFYVYVYTGITNITGKDWPGEKIEGTSNVYNYTHQSFLQSLNVIFNQGSDKPKTADLSSTSGTNNYYISTVSNTGGQGIKTNTSGFATAVSAGNLTMTSGIAYVAEDNGNGSATAHTITGIGYDIPFIISGAASTTYNFGWAGEGAALPCTNAFRKGTGAAITADETHHYYILSGDTFYRADNNIVATNKAYLELSQAATSKVLIFNDEETDGIEAVQNSTVKGKGDVYNLAGQRVSNDYKGIVIVNGKKMLNK